MDVWLYILLCNSYATVLKDRRERGDTHGFKGRVNRPHHKVWTESSLNEDACQAAGLFRDAPHGGGTADHCQVLQHIGKQM